MMHERRDERPKNKELHGVVKDAVSINLSNLGALRRCFLPNVNTDAFTSRRAIIWSGPFLTSFGVANVCEQKWGPLAQVRKLPSGQQVLSICGSQKYNFADHDPGAYPLFDSQTSTIAARALRVSHRDFSQVTTTLTTTIVTSLPELEDRGNGTHATKGNSIRDLQGPVQWDC